MGFEPTVQGDTPYNGLANRRLQPLGHLSTAGSLEQLYDTKTTMASGPMMAITTNPRKPMTTN